MALSKDQMQQVNIAVAKDMGIDVYTRGNDVTVIVDTAIPEDMRGFNIFNPDNTTDLNNAVEFYGINVEYTGGTWYSKQEKFPENGVLGWSKSRDESMRMAVAKASGVVV